jgi:membrane protease subunit HflC
MKPGAPLLGAAAVVLAAIVASQSAFTVSQTQQAVVLRFGDPVAGRSLVTAAGLHFKEPFIESVVVLDRRLLGVEASQQEILTKDSQRLVVDAFLRYRISDPLAFYQTVRTIQGAENQLGSVLDSVLRRVLGDATLTDVVRDRREELMARLLELVNVEAQRIGAQVVDARIRRADFPQEISAGVYGRMQTERQREAAEYRAQGSELAQTIRARADRDVTVIVATAQQNADKVRGQGDAERNRIFASAYGKDPDFFAFYRSMQAYAVAMGGGARFVLSPTSSFFRYFDNPDGAPPATSGPAAAAASSSAPTPGAPPEAGAPQRAPPG